MEIGIIGLARSGKTTLFQALTGLASSAPGAHLGVIKVPDPRLEELSRFLKPRKVVPAEVIYHDLGPSPPGLGRGEGFPKEMVNLLVRVDALLHVVRLFRDPSGAHPLGTLDPGRDVSLAEMELAFSDLALLERRLERVREGLKGAASLQREELLREQALLQRVKEGLEREEPLWRQRLTDEERKALEGFRFLSAKPILFILNIGEEQIPESTALEEEWKARHPETEVIALCAKLERELGELEDQEAQQFREALGLKEPGRERVLRLSHELLGLIVFFTIVSEEVRAWPVARGSSALKAAGKVHSDMERGFIRAEVIGAADLVRCGGMAEAKRRGLVKLEGKNYLVQDGDVLTILFHI